MRKTAKVTETANTGKKSVSTLPATRSANRLPATTQGVSGRGFENVERKDILMPRVKLLQQMSPEVTGELGMKAGTMVTSLSNINHGAKVVLTPILHFRSRIKWIKQDDGGGIECSSPDARTPLSDMICASCANCEHKDWDDTKKGKDQAPACTLYENFLVLIGDSTEPVLLPMERTKLRTAKKLFSIGALKNSDMWNWQYELGVSKEKNEQDQVYYTYTITDLARPTKEDRRKLCEGIWASLSKKTIIAADNDNPDAEARQGQQAAPASGDKY